MYINLNDREHATVLAALRYWQALLAKGEPPTGEQLQTIYHDIATNDGDVVPLDAPAIDELCEHLNCFPEAKPASPPAPAEKRVKMVCAECGSDDVLADAYAEWDKENQCWTVQNVMDKGHHCNACDGECRIEEVPEEDEDGLPETDPENIYNSPTIRQSIEEDRK
jgi:hypothetical protein